MTSILALQSLFILMMDHGLEYPKFYTSLYQLMEPSIFYAKFRTRFLQLLTKCLYSNPMLPAYVVAAFMKRLCQCALSAPPAGCLYIIALVSNLLRKHPECACLIHRGKVNGTSETLIQDDPFDSKAQDPVESRAIESSLWELVVLEKHYYHAVATMAKVCGTEGDNTLMYDMDDFVQHSYKNLFEQEKSRVGKRSAPLAFKEPHGLFQQGDIFDGIFKIAVGK
jgi:U3 small nucleolar RNA-associated protein 19